MKSKKLFLFGIGNLRKSKIYKVGNSDSLDMTPGNLFRLPDEFFSFGGKAR